MMSKQAKDQLVYSLRDTINKFGPERGQQLGPEKVVGYLIGRGKQIARRTGKMPEGCRQLELNRKEAEQIVASMLGLV